MSPPPTRRARINEPTDPTRRSEQIEGRDGARSRVENHGHQVEYPLRHARYRVPGRTAVKDLSLTYTPRPIAYAECLTFPA